MSKTSNYSFLLLKSSPELQAKILSQMDSDQQHLLKEKLQNVPLVGLEKLRQMKSQLCADTLPTLSETRLEPVTGIIPQEEICDDAEPMLDFIIRSDVFDIETRHEASACLAQMEPEAIQLIQSYIRETHPTESGDE